MSAPRYDDYAVIVNPDHAVLLVDDGLPCILNNPPHFWQNCEPVNHAVYHKYGITVTTANCLRTIYTDGLVTGFYLMEYYEGDLPSGGRWVERTALPLLTPPVTVENILTWLDWFEGDHPQRLPWYRPGYFRKMADSLREKLGEAITVEQVRTWERSMILRIHTETGVLYQKTIPPMFQHEPALAAWLCSQSPGQFPTVVDVQPGHTFLMAAYTGAPLMERPDLSLWQNALADYAALQISFAPHVDDLRTLGVPEHGLNWIDAHIDSLLEDEATLGGGIRLLTTEQIVSLQNLKPRLHAACEALSTFNIPLSLEHGDLWTGQIIARPDSGFVYTDWSDSAITHPLFSLPFFVAEVDNELPGIPDACEHLRSTYLKPWTIYESMPRLLQAYEYTRLLSPMYTSLQYYHDILPQMEIRWEMENMLAYNLRLLLRAAS